MPDPGQWLLLTLVLAAIAIVVGRPLLRGRAEQATAPMDAERETLALRHRLAVEALRDLEADRRAGSLDAGSYAAQRAEAEERAVRSLEALEAPTRPPEPARTPGPGGRRLAAWAGGIVIGLVLVAFALPGPIGLGERTRTNQALAQQMAAEQARLDRIAELTDAVAADPRDTEALSELADLFLAGGSERDLRGAAAVLLLLRDAAPRDASAHERLVTTYIRAGDWPDAAAATTAYAKVAGRDEPDIAFFRGLIALRGEGDRAEAIRWFDRFLEAAPDDPRVPMIRGLRAEAEAG
jgi:cytochrome c-type biogenesis protein CcmI